MTKIVTVALLASTALAAAAFANEGDPTERCDTVLIETENGPVRINAEDFDAKTMKKAKSQDVPAAPESGAPAADPAAEAGDGSQGAAAPVQRLVSSEGKGDKQRFYIVDAAGAKLTGEGIAEDGYATDAEAWAAITALIAKDQTA